MSTFEMEIRKLRQEMKMQIGDLRKLICTRLITDKWIQQDIACALLHVGPAQLRRVRVNVKNGVKVGSISWKKGKGKNVLYYLPDIEKYNSAFTIMN